MSFSYCFIPINVLRQSPFYLVQGSPVIAIGQAQNQKDWSVASVPTDSSSAALIITEP